MFLILGDRGVVGRAHQTSTVLEIREQTPVVNVEAERLGRRVKIGAVKKQAILLEDDISLLPFAIKAMNPNCTWIGKAPTMVADIQLHR